jgi:hypothetical protein
MEYTFYIIYCKDENIPDCYVGSTNNLDNRKRLHKSNCNNKNSNFFNFRVYKFIRENGGFDNWEFGVLGIHSFDNKNDKLIREQYYIEAYAAKLNINKTTHNKYEYNKNYREENKDYITLSKKNYQKNNRERLILKSKKYYEENKEQISLQKKEYREKNKEQISLQRKEKYYKKKNNA